MRLPQPVLSSALRTLVAIFAAASMTRPAVAVSCADLDMVVATFASHGKSVYMIPDERLKLVARDAEELTGGHYDGVTRGFLVRSKDGFVLGFEIGGCLLDPIQLDLPPQYAAEIGAA